MSNANICRQLANAKTCLAVLERKGIEAISISIPEAPAHSPRIYVHSSAAPRLTGGCYKTTPRSGRHYCAPLAGCQVRWTTPA